LDDDGQVGELDRGIDEDDGEEALDRFGLVQVLGRLDVAFGGCLGRGDNGSDLGKEGSWLLGRDGWLLLAVEHCVKVGVPYGPVVARVVDGNHLGGLGQEGEEVLVEVVVADKGEVLRHPALIVAVFLVT
jgi:hypothetical protein